MALFVVLDLAFAVTYLGAHRITGLAIPIVVAAVVVAVASLGPGTRDDERDGVNSLCALLCWLLSAAFAVLAPLALQTLWVDHVGRTESATVTSATRPTGRGDHQLTYTVRTSDGDTYSGLGESDLEVVGVGDRVSVRVDPTGVFGPQGERLRERGRYDVYVIVAGSVLAGLVALNAVVVSRRRVRR